MAWVLGRGECPEVKHDIEFESYYGGKPVHYKVAFFDKLRAYAPAEAWWEANKERLQQESPGKRLVLNAIDLSYSIVESQKLIGGKLCENDGISDYNREHRGGAPVPPHGLVMFCVLIPHA